MLYLASLAVLFWFALLPLLKLSSHVAIGTHMVIDGIRKTDVTEEEHLALRAQIEERKNVKKN